MRSETTPGLFSGLFSLLLLSKRFGIIASYANVAQSVEQTLRKRPVGGSIPFVGFYFLSAILLIMKSSHANSKDSRTNQKNGIRSLYISETIYLKAITKIQAETGREIYLPVAYRNQPPKEESKRTRLFHKAKSAYQAAVFVQPGNTINCVQNL